MLFIMALGEFRNVEANTSQGVKRIREFCKEYVQEGSAYEVNVSSSIRKATLQAVEAACSKSFDGTFPDTEMFAKCEEEVYKMMVDPFNRFVIKVMTSSSAAEEEGHKSSVADKDTARRLSLKLLERKKSLNKPSVQQSATASGMRNSSNNKATQGLV